LKRRSWSIQIIPTADWDWPKRKYSNLISPEHCLISKPWRSLIREMPPLSDCWRSSIADLGGRPRPSERRRRRQHWENDLAIGIVSIYISFIYPLYASFFGIAGSHAPKTKLLRSKAQAIFLFDALTPNTNSTSCHRFAFRKPAGGRPDVTSHARLLDCARLRV
jgi:hypothetical protein